MRLLGATLIGLACVANVIFAAETPSELANAAGGVRLSTSHLPNAIQLHERVISGGQPDGEAGFKELAKLGVKTVISVDGAKPDVEAAKRFGLRYVHLPHGYDGIPDDVGKSLAKAVRDLPGPIYIHCHHGKHRSPAAAVVACVSTGFLAPEQAVLVLKIAGTSSHYRGLYQSAAAARRLDDQTLDGLSAEFSEAKDLPPLVQTMVAIEHIYDRLKQIEKSEWNPPADHPDLHPAHEALMLREQFTELRRAETEHTKSERYQKLLAESEAAAKSLETLLQDRKEDFRKQASAALARVNRSCTECHAEFRDVPQEGNAR